MKGRSKSFAVWLVFLAMSCVASLAGALRTLPHREARQILEATGVRGGLIVHAGCGQGRLTAGLRADDGYLVHGLDPDQANVEKARKYIQSLGLYGHISIDTFKGE